MAAHFLAGTYGYVQTIDNKNGGAQINVVFPSVNPGIPGVMRSFPSAGVLFHAIVPQVLNTGVPAVPTVTINAVIEVLPTGSNHASQKYATDQNVAALNTAAA